jgi:uncharacterized sporulation protein YeaH/YhbH (DUF444 family)
VSNEKALARSIVNDILRDLGDRRGLRHEWEQIDGDLQEEIAVKWESIVAKRVAALTAEAAALKAEIARLAAPVSDSEFIRGCDQGRPTNGKVIFDRIILARATPPHGGKQ